MNEVMVVAEQLRGALSPTTAELVTAARELGGGISVVVIAKDPAMFLPDLAFDGVEEIVAVAVEGVEEVESDLAREVLVELINERSPHVVLLGSTVSTMGFGAAVAAQVGASFASEVVALRRDGKTLVAERSFYAGKVRAELEFSKRPVILLLRTATWAGAESVGAPPTTLSTYHASRPRVRHMQFREPPSSDVDITAAEFLLSIGRGIGERENVARFEQLAAKMSAVLSGSRPLIDAGWLEPGRQVGQSGKTVKPQIYLAFGISGAVQHLAGMKSSGVIIAVNKDPEAAIFGVAHYGVVGDLFDLAGELEKLY